ncbi:MAG: hypothetical protein AAGB31_09625, partial [Bdellovibrio sp.]
SHSKKWGLRLLVAAGVLFNIYSLWQSSYRRPLDLQHPYVYVNSTYEQRMLEKIILAEAVKRPGLLQENIQIGLPEQWPWPWLLRDFQKLHYNLCDKDVIEESLIYFCDPAAADFLEHKLMEPYWKLSLSLRQAREPVIVFMKKAVFSEIPFQGQAEVVGESLIKEMNEVTE